jgi:hypothetical protein
MKPVLDLGKMATPPGSAGEALNEAYPRMFRSGNQVSR